MTLSIIATDPDLGVIGAAVTSCTIAAARRVLHVRHGVGAVVAQAASEITWGEDILDALASGLMTQDAIQTYTRDDNQLAAISFHGDLAVHTGTGCIEHAGHVTGVNVACQVNTAVLPDAAQRMLAAFESTAGQLAERLVAALAASGGDARGHQAAGVMVTGRGPLRGHEDEPHVDLRVDDHRAPVAELTRLLALHRAHCTMRSIGKLPGADQIETLLPLLERHPDDPHLQRAIRRAQA